MRPGCLVVQLTECKLLRQSRLKYPCRKFLSVDDRVIISFIVLLGVRLHETLCMPACLLSLELSVVLRSLKTPPRVHQSLLKIVTSPGKL